MPEKEKRIVITGAGGYLARNIIPALMADGYSVAAVSSRSSLSFPGKNESHYQLIYSDMKDYGTLAEKMKNLEAPDAVVHFSWIGARGRLQDEEEFQSQNEEYSIRLLESAVRLNAKQFIQIGSMAEYGIQNGVITEETECRPISAYARKKYSCAQRMRIICSRQGIRFMEFRMGSMYGHYMGEDNLLGYICSNLSRGRRVKLKTACKQAWEYTHVDDFAEILRSALSSDAPSGIYNISTGDTHPLYEFIRMTEEKYGRNGYIEFGEEEQGIGCQNIRCDTAKIRKFFGKETFIPFGDGIETVIREIAGGE